VFGWIKQWGGLRQFKLRGTDKVSAVFDLNVIAFTPDSAGRPAPSHGGGGCMSSRWPKVWLIGCDQAAHLVRNS
jgi:hypothetical protein